MKVLLAIDDSPFSESATQFLSDHYRSEETEILVLHTTGSLTETDLNYGWAPKMDWQGVQKAEELVSDASHTLSHAGFRVTIQVQGGDPRLKIIESAKVWHPDLIVVGSHGRTGLNRLLLGSVSESVARNAPCSVAIIRRKDGAVRSETSSRKGTAMRILLAIDGSQGFSEAAIDAIAQQFRPEHVEVCILHVVEPQFFVTDAQMKVRVDEGNELVANAGRPLEVSGFKVLTSIDKGDPRMTIIDYAANWGADLIVVSSQGRTSLDRALIGSVSENVARHSPCSVEIVRLLGPVRSFLL